MENLDIKAGSNPYRFPGPGRLLGPSEDKHPADSQNSCEADEESAGKKGLGNSEGTLKDHTNMIPKSSLPHQEQRIWTCSPSGSGNYGPVTATAATIAQMQLQANRLRKQPN